MSHRLFICCCKGFFRDDNRDELYQLLDVDRRATAVDIKRAYRNKSLQMHPDKLNQRGQEVTEEDRANFQRMKAAYDVLSDPQKRELYDKLGETGMMMMEDPFAAREKMLKNFLKMNTRDRLRLVIFVLLLVGAVLLWPILFCIKVDGKLSGSWIALWTPLWIYNALGLYYYIYLVSLGQIKPPEGMEDEWTDPHPLPLRILGLIKWVLLIYFQVAFLSAAVDQPHIIMGKMNEILNRALLHMMIFLTLRLDDEIGWSWAEVGSPLLVWMGMHLLEHLYEATRQLPQKRQEESMLDQDDEDSSPDAEKREQAKQKQADAREALPRDVMWILQLVFLILKLDDEVNWNWWVVFLPVWLVLVGQMVKFCGTFMVAKALSDGIEGKSEEELSDEEKMRAAASSQLFAQAMTSCCCWMFALVTVVLAVNAIAGADYSAFVIFIPQFIIAGLLVCCMTCFICCMRLDPDAELGPNGVDVEQGVHAGVSAQQHVSQAYGTYNPPPMGGGAMAGGAKQGAGSGAAAPAVIIPMPPAAAPAAAVSTQNSVLPAPPAQPRPVPASTPAPENQEDGGID